MTNINIETIKTEEFTLNGDKNKVISFVPTDINILNRYKECLSEFKSKQEEYEALAKIEINENTDMDTTLNLFNKVKEVDLFFKEKLDYIFNSKISDVIFGDTSCLAINSKGVFIFQDVLDTLFNICKQRTEEKTKSEIKKIKQNPKAQEYLNKYNNHNKHSKKIQRHDFKKSN